MKKQVGTPFIVFQFTACCAVRIAQCDLISLGTSTTSVHATWQMKTLISDSISIRRKEFEAF